MVTNTPVVEFVKKENISWTRKIHAKLINSTALQPLNLKSSKIFAFTGCLNKRFKGYNLSSPVTRPFIRVITPFITAGFGAPLKKGHSNRLPMFTLELGFNRVKTSLEVGPLGHWRNPSLFTAIFLDLLKMRGK